MEKIAGRGGAGERLSGRKGQNQGHCSAGPKTKGGGKKKEGVKSANLVAGVSLSGGGKR